MPAPTQNLITVLQRSLLKSAASALPAAPKVQNPAPRPLKTPSFTTKPPAIRRAVADVRPGLSTTVTQQNQTLGTAKSPSAKQVAVSKPIMAPKEFKAIPTVPLAKTAAQPSVADIPALRQRYQDLMRAKAQPVEGRPGTVRFSGQLKPGSPEFEAFKAYRDAVRMKQLQARAAQQPVAAKQAPVQQLQGTITTVNPSGAMRMTPLQAGPTRFNAATEKVFGSPYETMKLQEKVAPAATFNPGSVQTQLAKGNTFAAHNKLLAAIRESMPPAASPKGLLNPTYGTVNKSTGQPVYGSRTYEFASGNPSSWSASAQARAAEIAKQRAAAKVKAAPKPAPENPHYEARPAVQAQRLEEARNAAVQRYAQDDPTVVRRKTDAQIAQETAGYHGLGDRVSRALRGSTVARGLYGRLRGEFRDGSRTLDTIRSLPDYAHDAVNGMEIMANGAQKGLDWTLSKGIKWIDPRSWGSSMSARLNRLSHDNDWDNARRVYDTRHEKLVGGMRIGDPNDPTMRKLYGVQRGLGEFAGSAIATGGAGTALKGVGAGVTAGGRLIGSGAGSALANGLQRVGLSASRAGGVKNFVTGLGADVGRAAAAPLHYAGTALTGAANAPAKTLGAAGHAIRHPIQTGRAVTGGVRAAGTAVRHPLQAVRAGWRRGLVGKGFDSAIRADNAYRVGNGVMTGDYTDAAASAGELGWYDSMRRLNPFWGTVGGIAVPVAAHLALSKGEPPVE